MNDAKETRGPAKRSPQCQENKKIKEAKKKHQKEHEGSMENVKDIVMNTLMDHKVPVKSILDLCPRFKKKILKAWAVELNQEIKEMEEEAEYNMAQPEETPRTRDDNVAKIKMTIETKEMQGVILDGGSGFNVITESMAMELGLKWEPIPFNIRKADNRTVVPGG